MVCNAIKVYSKKVSTHTHTVIDWSCIDSGQRWNVRQIQTVTNLNWNNRTKKYKIWTSPSIGTGNRKRIELKKTQKRTIYRTYFINQGLILFSAIQNKRKSAEVMWCVQLCLLIYECLQCTGKWNEKGKCKTAGG